MKHPAETDLHDLDKLRIDELERDNLVLTYDLEHAQDRLAECECALEDMTIQHDNCQAENDPS